MDCSDNLTFRIATRACAEPTDDPRCFRTAAVVRVGLAGVLSGSGTGELLEPDSFTESLRGWS